MTSAHWRLLTSSPATGAENMALDEALMSHARESGEWVLRVYSWSRPTISLGRNQTASGRYDLATIAARGIDIVRRPTGGRAILHDREITYSVTAPLEGAGDLRDSYRRITGILVKGLRALGVDATVPRPTKRATAPGMTPCFDEPSAGELTFEGRKLAGSAQWRFDGALLQHGSILLEDDQSTLAGLVLGEQPAGPPPATLSQALGSTPSISEVAAALRSAVLLQEDADATNLRLDEELRARAEALVVRYLDDEWTWRR
jgi:lipoate-protein ligase A